MGKASWYDRYRCTGCLPRRDAMLIQAVGLALLAALSPTAVLVSAVLLGSARPQRMVLIYLAGAIVMTVIMAAIVYALLQSGHLYQPRERQPRYGLRLGLGLSMLLAGAYLKRRGPKRPDPARKNKGIISRLISRPAARTAFIVGVLVYTPSLTTSSGSAYRLCSRCGTVANVQ